MSNAVAFVYMPGDASSGGEYVLHVDGASTRYGVQDRSAYGGGFRVTESNPDEGWFAHFAPTHTTLQQAKERAVAQYQADLVA